MSCSSVASNRVWISVFGFLGDVRKVRSSVLEDELEVRTVLSSVKGLGELFGTCNFASLALARRTSIVITPQLRGEPAIFKRSLSVHFGKVTSRDRFPQL